MPSAAATWPVTAIRSCTLGVVGGGDSSACYFYWSYCTYPHTFFLGVIQHTFISRIMGMVRKSTCAIFESSLSILGFTNPSRNLNAKSAASDRRSLSNIVRGWSPAECMYLDRFSKLRRSRRDRCFQSLSLTSARSPVFHIPSIALLLHHRQQPHIHIGSLICTRFA